jgi:hypothetical protein
MSQSEHAIVLRVTLIVALLLDSISDGRLSVTVVMPAIWQPRRNTVRGRDALQPF